MMREDNLLCVRRRKFVLTTDSRHNLPVYPNLAGQRVPTAINQLWVADITYIRLRQEFVYLAVMLDAFSRRVIGWALGRSPDAGLAVAALEMALAERKPQPGFVHHSDRGVQYASQEYTARLQRHDAQISMSRKGNPYDNAACESFVKTLKYEELYCNEYHDFQEARASIGEFLQQAVPSFVQIDVEPRNASWSFPAEHVLIGDAALVMRQLGVALADAARGGGQRAGVARVAAHRNKHGYFDQPAYDAPGSPIHPQRITWPDGRFSTSVQVDSPITLQRIRTALAARGIPELTAGNGEPPAGTTEFIAAGGTPVLAPMEDIFLRVVREGRE